MLKNRPIRYKLLISYSILFTLSTIISSAFIYSLVRKNIEKNIENELINTTSTLLNMVRTSAAVSIKNNLRAAAERNREMVTYFYRQYRQGIMPEDMARQQAQAVLLSQTIGRSGYIYCVDSKGVVVVHPEKALLNTDVSGHAFVKEQLDRKEGYVEYEWKNPGETICRPKALYMVYFAPWDWIISVSSYRKEFNSLVNVDDFRKSILSLQFGKTGYSYVIDVKGNIVIHPKLQGLNILESEVFPSGFLREMLKKKSGKLIYSWKNPGEVSARDKLVIFDHIPEYGWTVASSSYLEEFYGPLTTIRKWMIVTVAVTLILVLPITSSISASITNPLQELTNNFNRVAAGDFTSRMEFRSQDEIGQLSRYFNNFMVQLEKYNNDLNKQIRVRRKAEEALRESEDRYRSVMEAAPDPIVVYDMTGKVIYFNPMFTRIFGWTMDECCGSKMDHFVPDANWTETQIMIEKILSDETLSSIETQRYTKSGDIIHVSISGATFRDRNRKLAGSVIILRNITEAKRLEKQVMDIGDRERQKIGQDLHDDLCPHLIGIEGLGTVLTANLIEKSLTSDAELAQQIVTLIEKAIAKARRLARGLCPVHLVSHGLQSALKEVAITAEANSGIVCRFDGDDAIVLDDNSAATHLYYIAQEAVNNARQHAGATCISISLRQTGQHLHLRIEDNGKGLPETFSSSGMGLQIMKYRAKMISGASIEIKNGAGSGTVVHVSIEN